VPSDPLTLAALPPPVERRARLEWRHGTTHASTRALPEETAIAFSYNRLSHAVMMATPAALEDFAVGFSLAERIVEKPADIEDLAVVPVAAGIELRMWIAEHRMVALTARRRHVAGPTGCGLCGLESLEDAMRPPPPIRGDPRFSASALGRAMAALGAAQPLHAETRAVHAAALWLPSGEHGSGLVAVREDVGRHNALDKLAGALARAGTEAAGGAVLLTSRVSVELVQKTAQMGAAVVVAVSAPTALAVRVAEAAGITIAAIARSNGFEVFTHPRRIDLDA
jgi:FdhD protein